MRALNRMRGLAHRSKQLNAGKNFAATQIGMFLDGFNFRRFLEDCYDETSRRMSVFEPELLRPSFLPQWAAGALKALRLWRARAEVEPNTDALPPRGGGRLADRAPLARVHQ